MDGPTGLATDVCRQRWPKHTHGHGWATRVFCLRHPLVVFRGKSDHSEVVRLMRVKHFCCANPPAPVLVYFANHATYASQRYFQALRFRSGWSKQRSLRVAAPGWPRLDRYALYRCARTMLFQIKLQELQQHSGVLHRHWKAEGANPKIGTLFPLLFPGIPVLMYVQLK